MPLRWLECTPISREASVKSPQGTDGVSGSTVGSKQPSRSIPQPRHYHGHSVSWRIINSRWLLVDCLQRSGEGKPLQRAVSVLCKAVQESCILEEGDRWAQGAERRGGSYRNERCDGHIECRNAQTDALVWNSLTNVEHDAELSALAVAFPRALTLSICSTTSWKKTPDQTRRHSHRSVERVAWESQCASSRCYLAV